MYVPLVLRPIKDCRHRVGLLIRFGASREEAAWKRIRFGGTKAHRSLSSGEVICLIEVLFWAPGEEDYTSVIVTSDRILAEYTCSKEIHGFVLVVAN